MGDAKSFLDLTMDDLRDGSTFQDDGIPIAAHDHDRAVGAGSPEVPPESREIKITATPEELNALNATPEGRAKIAAMFGIKNEEDKKDVIDTSHREQLDDMAQRIGGEDQLPGFDQAYEVANSIFALDEELEDNPSLATPGLRNAAALKLVTDFEAILAVPERARQELKDFYNRDLNDPVRKAYDAGDDYTVEAITMLHQAAMGEPPVGRTKSKGDGHII